MRQPPSHRPKVLDFFQKPSDRPVLVGTVAIALKLRIAEVEEVLEDLVAEGVLRHATDAEKRQFDIRLGYVLV